MKDINILLKMIYAERKLNYSNKGVLGGFNKFFLEKLEENLSDELKRSLIEYEKIDLKSRKRVLDLLEDFLKDKKVIPKKKKDKLNFDFNLSAINLASKKKEIWKNNLRPLEDFSQIKGLGSKRIEELHKNGVLDVNDLLYIFPRKYEDRSNLNPISFLNDGEYANIFASILDFEVVKPRPKLNILKVRVSDKTGIITAVWFNQQFLKKNFSKGQKILLSGKVDLSFNKQIMVEKFDLIKNQEQLEKLMKINPIYSANRLFSQNFIQKLIKTAVKYNLKSIEENLTEYLLSEYELLDKRKSIYAMHYPLNFDEQALARKRLAFEELILLQLAMRKDLNGEETLYNEGLEDSLNYSSKFLEALPFELTKAQKKVMGEIGQDLKRKRQMSRLVQGDVGSGKTVVAIWSILYALGSGYQAAFMAPTEILAEQHYKTLLELIAPLNLDIRLSLLKGSMTAKEKAMGLESIKDNTIDIVVGTHALIQESVEFANLGLIVIDEQHRFGVKQRYELEKKGKNPDLLVMTATPIPRSLALTVYGDLDLSIIDELPPGRKKVDTYHIPERSLEEVYDLIEREVRLGRQVYFVCPLVEESEKMDLEDATQLAIELQEDIFPELSIGLLHGRLKSEQKEDIMSNFKRKNIDILVSTTVIEVGVDVPNATVMVIKNAERFGLAQLHQLRGRVGRGGNKSYCILISDPKTKESKARMEIMTSTNDGFKIAEEDLLLRGPGDFFGTKQHGLPELKLADLTKDMDLIEKSQDVVEYIIKDGFEKKKYANLAKDLEKMLSKKTIN